MQTYKQQRLGTQLLGVEICPHCSIASPMLQQVWFSSDPVPRSDHGPTSRWAAFRCTTCGGIVTARGQEGVPESNPVVVQIYPQTRSFDASIPERARNYLMQAYKTLGSPDASVVMSASAVDAMLKHHGLTEGTLNVRIKDAVSKGLLTDITATWAHQIRLDSNSPRHADASDPHMSRDDATRALDFAVALADYLFVLPSKMPTK